MAVTTSRTLVKYALRVPVGVTHYDGRIDAAVSATDRYVLGLIRQPSGLAVVTTTEYPDVYTSAQTRVLLRRRPIVGVVAVTNNGEAVAATSYRIDADAGMLVRIDDEFWAPGESAVQVHYGAGYDATTLPDDLVEAATQIAASMVNRAPLAGLDAQDDGGIDIRVSKAQLPPEAMAILAKYVDW